MPGVQLGGLGWGNAFNIQHGPYVATYMHMRKGTLNPALITGFPQGVQFPNGAQVKAGDFLGMAGNAGSSSAPHLHVGLVIEDPGKPNFSIPLGFSNISVLSDSEIDINNVGGSPWATATNQGLPWEDDPTVANAVAMNQFYRPVNPSKYAAIDPVALVLGAHSAIYVLLTLPDPPPIEVIAQEVRTQVARMSAAERAAALTRLGTLEAYAAALKQGLQGGRP